MNREQFIAESQENGWDWEEGQDSANKEYPRHSHGFTRLFTTGGSIRLKIGEGDFVDYLPGDICEIQSGELHEGQVGVEGWSYMAAWRPDEADTFEGHE